MTSVDSSELWRRVEDRIAAWRVLVACTRETESSILAFGRRGDKPVVLKVIKNRGDEWRCGELLEAFEGQGTVRVYEHGEGAILLERLIPGTTLASVSLNGGDDEATDILADVIAKIASAPPVHAVPTPEEWGRGFERYAASGDTQIEKHLVLEAHRVYSALCGSQSRPRLLHGDLHHYNVLWDAERGWVAVDPKGVVGEIAYEVGAALRNPYEQPAMFIEPRRIEKRVDRFALKLELDPKRVLAWAFAQAVLSAVWAVEDGFALERDHPPIVLARAIRPMLEGLLHS